MIRCLMSRYCKFLALISVLFSCAALAQGNDKTVKVEELAQPTAGGVGVVTSAQANIDSMLWRETNEQALIEAYNGLFVRAKPKPVVDLLQRLLAAEMGRADFSEQVLLVRTDTLIRMGQVRLAAQLLKAVPDAMKSDVLMQRLLQLQAMDSTKKESVCEAVEAQQSQDPAPFLQQLQVICLLHSDKPDAAMLAYQLLEEANAIPEFLADVVEKLKSDDKAKREEPIEKTAFSDQEYSWLALAGLMPKLKDVKEVSLRDVAIIALNSSAEELYRKKAMALSLNSEELAELDSEEVDIPPYLLSIGANDKATEIHRGQLAYALRKVWFMPVSIETEDALANIAWKDESLHLSPAWREEVMRFQENGEFGLAVLALLRPLTEPLHRYGVHDMAFVVQSLRNMGLSRDAVAFAHAALSEG